MEIADDETELMEVDDCSSPAVQYITEEEFTAIQESLAEARNDLEYQQTIAAVELSKLEMVKREKEKILEDTKQGIVCNICGEFPCGCYNVVSSTYIYYHYRFLISVTRIIFSTYTGISDIYRLIIITLFYPLQQLDQDLCLAQKLSEEENKKIEEMEAKIDLPTDDELTPEKKPFRGTPPGKPPTPPESFKKKVS